MLVNLHTAVIGVRPEISLGVLAATERAPSLKAAQAGERVTLDKLGNLLISFRA